ncbi:MAG: hypothetical protein EAZ85_00745 [Bacteroidetes bacterium]|nr:MAG: hypothetical protein EAZ85_00745 [Bacteroidota bacterium]TAG87652.1 MAG: hypothetical protein EAZ20_10215 [Bacteroidota bacterium]
MKDDKLNVGNKRYNYTSNLLIKSENYIFDDIRKGIIGSGNVDNDIAQSISSIQELRKRYSDRALRFSVYD